VLNPELEPCAQSIISFAYRVTPGDVSEVETLADDVGAEIEFGRVLMTVVNDSTKSNRASLPRRT
jgi:ribosomal protein L21